MYAVMVLIVLVCISSVSAADDAAKDIIKDYDTRELILDETTDGDISSAINYDDENFLENDNFDSVSPINEGSDSEIDDESDLLSADERTYSDLSLEIGSGGDIELSHGYYRYDSGSTIQITIANTVINGNGAVIDMSGSGIQALMVNAAGVTIKNLSIKNVDYEGSGGAIFFKGFGTLENCNFTNNTANGDNGNGSAIYFLDDGEVRNCNFNNNTAYRGGAVFFNGFGTVENCNFTNNNASYEDGAVCFLDDGEVRNSNFINNTAECDGGAVEFDGTGTVENCNFTNNAATNGNGGAIWTFFGNVRNCNFIDNTAKSGGAIRFYRDGIATNCNFTNNAATDGDGGAVLMSSGDVSNCSFANDTATGDGGAILMSLANVTDCSFAQNSANRGGAIFSQRGCSTADTCIFKTSSDTINNNTLVFPPTLDVENFIAVYNSGATLPFDLKTNRGMSVDNGNISISIYHKNNDSWVGNYSCLSGEGWTVDLPIGYYYAIYNTEYAEFTPINRTIRIMPDYQLYVNLTSILSYTKNVIITAKSNIPNDVMEGELLFIFPNGTEIKGTYHGDGTWWTSYAFDDYGDYIVKASYIGFDDVIINNATISIRNIVPIHVDDISVTYGEATVVVSVGEAINGQNIRIAVNESSTNATVIGGEAKATFNDLHSGEYVISVEYSGDGRNAANSTTAKLTVPKADSSLSLVDVVLDYGESINLTVGAEGALGIIAEIDGVDLAVDGFTIKIPSLDVGNHTLTVTTIADSSHDPVSKTVAITVNKLKTKLTASAVTATYNVNKDLVISLTDSNGKALGGVDVTVALGSAKVYQTDKNGQLKINVANLLPKAYTAEISFAGNAYFVAAFKSVKVVVDKASPKMTAKKKTFKLKVKTKKYAITLKNNVKKAIKGAKVTLKVNKKTYKAKTNKKGKAVFKIKNLKKKGTYKAVIKFAGNKYYKKVTKKVKIKVKK